MSNHSGDTNKMVRECVSNEQVTGEATPNEELRQQILSPCVAKNEREWWAARTIEKLERQLNAANQRIKHLRDGIAKQNQTIEQACGKVLGYPWFKDDQKNFPGSTEKDGVCVGDHLAETIVSELASRYTEALARIKRLEEAIQERDKEWFQVIESILGFHPVSMTEALHIGIERIKKQKQRIKRLEEAGDALCTTMLRESKYLHGENFKASINVWRKAKEDKP